MKKLYIFLCFLFSTTYFSNNQAIFGIVNAALETVDVLSFGAVTTADNIVNSVLPFGCYRSHYYPYYYAPYP